MATPNETGVYRDVPREEYDRIDREHWSALRHMKRSPKHYTSEKNQPSADTDAKRLGRARHAATLEPSKFLAQWAVWDGGRRYGKEWDKFREQHTGLEILKSEEYEACVAMAKAVRAHPDAGPLLRDGSAEVTVQWTYQVPGLPWDPEARIECKGRLDYLTAGAIVDLKTCRDASPEAFARTAWNLDYAAQAAFYVDGYAAATGMRLPYIIIAAESEYDVVQVYHVPERILANGRDLYRTLLQRLHVCRKSWTWPAYASGSLDLELPAWAQRNEDEDLTGLGLVVNE